MMYGWLLALLMAVTAFGVGAWKNNKIDRLSTTIVTQQDLIIAKDIIASSNAIEIQECKDTNTANAKAQADLETQVVNAIQLVAEANTNMRTKEQAIEQQAKEFRESADDQCYKMDGDELPTDFVDSVYNSSTN